mmetsp:Transcript_2965/g.8679  ORF Transcript_2965/g.8679 Transcript_2965/m.8679 type:complete len:230 (+) Transcript_2965:133-822(+)
MLPHHGRGRIEAVKQSGPVRKWSVAHIHRSLREPRALARGVRRRRRLPLRLSIQRRRQGQRARRRARRGGARRRGVLRPGRLRSRGAAARPLPPEPRERSAAPLLLPRRAVLGRRQVLRPHQGARAQDGQALRLGRAAPAGPAPRRRGGRGRFEHRLRDARRGGEARVVPPKEAVGRVRAHDARGIGCLREHLAGRVQRREVRGHWPRRHAGPEGAEAHVRAARPELPF